MSIEYAVVPNPLTVPPSFRPQVIVKDTVTLQQLLARVAERTSQSREAVDAVATALADEAVLALLQGDSFSWEGFLQLSPTLSGRIASAAGDLPSDSRAGVSARISPAALARFQSQASYTRVAADNTGPQILEVLAINGNLQSLRERDLVELSGERLSFNPEAADEGVFLVENTGPGAPELRAGIYLDTGERRVRLQAPAGIAAGLPYLLRIDARRPNGAILRSFTWQTPVIGGV